MTAPQLLALTAYVAFFTSKILILMEVETGLNL